MLSDKKFSLVLILGSKDKGSNVPAMSRQLMDKKELRESK